MSDASRPLCMNCNDTGFEDYDSIPPEIADDRFAEIVDWIASSRLEFEDASCCCHINPPCNKCVNTHHVAVCDKCSKASVLEAMDSIRSASESLQETWERHARQAADLQKKVAEANAARDQVKATLQPELNDARQLASELEAKNTRQERWLSEARQQLSSADNGVAVLGEKVNEQQREIDSLTEDRDELKARLKSLEGQRKKPGLIGRLLKGRLL